MVLNAAIARPVPAEIQLGRDLPAWREGADPLVKAELANLYREYIACLNRQDWAKLESFLHDGVQHNGRPIGIAGYRTMLERDFREIPDLRFDIQLLICDPPNIACRLGFDCTPTGTFFDLRVDGKRIRFAENVFYEYRMQKIERVWSVIDKAAIEAQL